MTCTDRRHPLARPSNKKRVVGKSVVSRTPGETAARPGVAKAASAGAGYRAKVRMYRQGLGDCFLISLPRTDRSDRPFYIMIDCGVVLGTPDPKPIMTQVIENVVATTGGAIDVLVSTHEPWDHLSGFVQARQPFGKLKAGEILLPWPA